MVCASVSAGVVLCNSMTNSSSVTDAVHVRSQPTVVVKSENPNPPLPVLLLKSFMSSL
ncbi:hypothetical protein F2Q69_00056996 [Brassica cretica]|uniref:Uncharacterized protein n=1 Tax=Brassica cretica TaxID=69181 RepID=A0A8S9MV67_BRACR|nr:hypothetical protein F2Q69_00056996 [Brassica cretica]